ncbi:ATP-binding protein [Bdellovibrio bacteriovorus]|uniref:Sensory/regulatory protein RpfC n=1 Tax=Bdellovibrio bacteriovorus str. Tiberius TaxID=1069642 RepID=K7ZGH2_BDEBC|nr:ATP-binding protein [Bdellovibrio bacteriovorus]AFY02472.1 sensor histidine kinase/response regulator [Bdellovibrio bacteriovorus str. Tiberius]
MFHRLLKTWAFQTFLIFVLYYLTGRLGLLLALPPGYASLVWPPFGISIAALLLFGVNRWPGVLIGAFLVNARHLESISNLLLPLGISAGNTLSVIIAALLIRRFLHFPKRFYLEREVILFLFLSGPVAALFSAGWGVGLLYFNDLLSQKNILMNWIHWFVGDAIGGLIFAPLALMFSTQSRRYWLKSVTKVLVPVCVAFALILSASQYLTHSEQEKQAGEFTRKAEFTFNVLEKDFNGNIDMLISLKSFFDSSTTVTRQEFREFATTLHSRRPEVQALAWIPYDRTQPEKFRIEYIEPSALNSKILGYDFGTHPDRNALLKKALDKKRIITSSPLELNEFNHPARGIYLFLAIGRPEGVLLEVLRLDGILRDLTDVLNDPSYRVLIEDVTNTSARELMVDTLTDTANDFHADFKWSSHLEVGDRQWEITVQQDTSLRQGSAFNAAVFLLTSLIFVFLICALLLTIANRIITVEEIVDEKTQHLIDLNVQLKKASETKSEFLANMSHEIRTPLNVIVGMSDLLEESPLNDDQKHYVEISKKAGHNLLSIINDILDISKIEAGLVTLEKTEVDLHSLVADITEMFELKAREKNLELTVYLSEDTHSIFMGDPTRIRQVLSNLISNSLKFTTDGSIRVELMKNQTELDGNLIFHVSDTGIGIPRDKIPQLFQPFTQADSTITRKFGGTGLGLSISKRLVKMMNGDITIESELHRGSRFSFSLELPWLRDVQEEMQSPSEDSGPASTGTPTTLEPLSILIVDDTDDNRLLIKAYLKNTPHQITEASNGRQALELAQKQRFDLILMDMQMPVMDGFTATQKIRKWEQEHKQPPTTIWALTAFALKNEIDRSLSVGCNLHLIKPLRKADLLNHIQKLSEERHQSR